MKITICIGSSCHLKGSREIVMTLQRLISEKNLDNKVELSGSFCMGECKRGVSVRIDGSEEIFSVRPETAQQFFHQEVLGRLE
ncbi:MAG: (2Fe-2S) ferredoxin domain-containing protein [Lachnospiraceae bacterium]|nr:(2Fe-2S) ferredoxin domain-containing protein [Lachnospiraceae bacterium]